MSLDKIRIRGFQSLRYVEAADVLRKLRQVEHDPAVQALDEKVRTLRTNDLKPFREARLAALFAYSMGQTRFRVPVYVAAAESEDYDCVLAWKDADGGWFSPVQLKELPPDHINPRLSLEDLLAKLKRYGSAPELHVAIHTNRATRLEFGPWMKIHGLDLGGVWLFGGLNAEATKWFVYGDLLGDPNFREFEYPQ